MTTSLRIPVCLSGLLVAAFAHAEVINISAASPAGVTVSLVAGADYTFSYAAAGTAGASFLGWNPWGSVSGCDADGAHCTTGFSERFKILGTGGNVYSFAASAGPYASAALANASAVSGPIVGSLNGGPTTAFGAVVPFHQANDIDAVFYLPVSGFPNATGGVSLILQRVDAVPEPESSAFLLAGLAVLGGLGRWRTRKVAAAAGTGAE